MPDRGDAGVSQYAPSVIRRQRHMMARIALGKEVWSQIKPQRTPLGYGLWLLWYPPLWFIGAMAKIVSFMGGLIAAMFLGYEGRPRNKDKRRSDNPYDIEIGPLIKII